MSSLPAKFQQAQALHQQGRLLSAQALYEEILRCQPRHYAALHLLGVVASQTQRPERAVELIGKALRLNPRDAIACNNYGIALAKLRRYGEAVASYDRALALNPKSADAWFNRGIALFAQQQYEAALASHDRAIALEPRNAEAHLNRGNTLACLSRHEEAVRSFDDALAMQPDLALAHGNRATSLRKLKRFAAALAGYARAIALKPDYAEAFSNRGVLLADLKQWEAAVADYDRAIALRPDYADAYNNRGNALQTLKRYEAAIASFDAALALEPQYDFARGMRHYASMQICEWERFDADLAVIEAQTARGEAAEPPFCLMAASDSPALLQQAAVTWVRKRYANFEPLPGFESRAPGSRIRLGYFSADFRDHPVAALTAELFAIHDRSRFEVSAFAFGAASDDPMRRRLEGAFDRFIDVRERSDREVALLARGLGIDIAVDLGGFTEDCRPSIFALRAAPIQVCYLGYPGTMGTTFMDYLLADARVIPTPSRRYYSEKIIRLRECFMPNDSGREPADRSFTREELGLPPDGVVFCCFNAAHKITPATFDRWMRILTRVADGVLWLSQSNPQAVANLRRAAAARGVDPDRLVFARRIPSAAEHLARHRLADLFLDTLPYNAHATAADALRAGLPVLTLAGQSFAGRVGASLLMAARLPELITTTAEQYESLAIELASDAARLAGLKQRLAANRRTAPLFEPRRYARELESAYEAIQARYLAGLPPEHLDLAEDPAAMPS